MDHKAFTAHFTATASRRLGGMFLKVMTRRQIFRELTIILLEIAEAHDTEVNKLEFIEREQWDYILHINESIAIHCPLAAWQLEEQ